MTETIKMRIIETKNIDIKDLEPFQGGLKTLSETNYNRLRKVLIEEGFTFTVHAWKCDKVNYIIDGHQRVSVLIQMRKAGYKIPKIPVAFVSARTFSDAKKLVLMAVSQYGKLDKTGFDDFVIGEDFDFDADFDFPDVGPDFLVWDKEIKETEITGAKELGEDEFQDFDNQCPKCSFEWSNKK